MLPKGRDAATLYLELRVPHKHGGNEKTSFVLLPGFEARKSYRETLVDFAISSSDAAIFAFDGRLLSQQDNYRHLKELAEKIWSTHHLRNYPVRIVLWMGRGSSRDFYAGDEN